MTFGERLRALRRAKKMSQRELADRVDLDFTYLSKIENDRMPPPSAKAIAALARELEADVDELTVLAGKLPEDLADLFGQNVDAIKLFRSFAGDVRTSADWRRHFQQDVPPHQDEP